MTNTGRLSTPNNTGASLTVEENNSLHLIGKTHITSIPYNSSNVHASLCGDNDNNELRISGSTIWQEGGGIILYPLNIKVDNPTAEDYHKGSVKLQAIDYLNSSNNVSLHLVGNDTGSNYLYLNTPDGLSSAWNGVLSYNQNDKCSCIKYSNGSIISFGTINSGNTGTVVVTFPNKYEFTPAMAANVTGISATGIFTVRYTQTNTNVTFKTFGSDGNVAVNIAFSYIAFGR